MTRCPALPPLALALLLLCRHGLGAEPFSFDLLRQEARRLASSPYAPPPDDLHDFWKNLSYDQHRDIRFNMHEGLWAREKLPFSIDFFHPGWTARKTIRIHEVSGGEAIPLPFQLQGFDYGKQVIPPGIPPPPGYAGWRARCHLNSAGYMDEFLVFLGASYFRAVPAHTPYGVSARGLSIDSGLPGVPEEFPDFRTFFLQRPAADAKNLTAWSLLDGPSVAGAFQFIMTPGPVTVTEVEAEITLRHPVRQLGLVPFSSMFWFGEGTHPQPLDFRPEVHDSDGVLMELAQGARHFRPLDQTPNRFRHCVFALEQPRSWSLVQRDRSFLSYQDSEAHYHDRPSVQVEPIEGFERGNLHLIEMPATGETYDNVVLLWEPQAAPPPGQPFRFRYRLRWLREAAPSGIFEVRDTRVGTPLGHPAQILVAVDFARPLQPVARNEAAQAAGTWVDIAGWKPVITLNQPAAKLLHAGLSDLSRSYASALPAGLEPDKIHLPQVLRAFFIIEPNGELDHIDMTCELRDDQDQTMSERWLYLWMRPG